MENLYSFDNLVAKQKITWKHKLRSSIADLIISNLKFASLLMAFMFSLNAFSQENLVSFERQQLLGLSATVQNSIYSFQDYNRINSDDREVLRDQFSDLIGLMVAWGMSDNQDWRIEDETNGRPSLDSNAFKTYASRLNFLVTQSGEQYNNFSNAQKIRLNRDLSLLISYMESLGIFDVPVRQPDPLFVQRLPYGDELRCERIPDTDYYAVKNILNGEFLGIRSGGFVSISDCQRYSLNTYRNGILCGYNGTFGGRPSFSIFNYKGQRLAGESHLGNFDHNVCTSNLDTRKNYYICSLESRVYNIYNIHTGLIVAGGYNSKSLCERAVINMQMF